MNLHRLFSTLRQLNRFPELLRCYRYFEKPTSTALAFTTIWKGKFPRVLHYNRNNVRYTIPLPAWEDLTTAWVVLLGNEYRVLSDDRIVLDIGANIGTFAIYAHSMNKDLKIYSIEPYPETFDALAATIKANQEIQNITLRQCAIAGSDGQVKFNSASDIPSHSRSIDNSHDPSDYVAVDAYCLETFLDREQLATVDFVKIDIEGSEYDLIGGASRQTLRRSKRYGIEYHSKGVKAISDKMSNCGFEITDYPKQGISGVVEFTRMD